MSEHFWLILVSTVVGWVVTAVSFMRRQEKDRLKIEAETDKRIAMLKAKHDQECKQLEDAVRRLEQDFHQHELNNERQFEKYYTDMNSKFDQLFTKIDELKNMFFNYATKDKFKRE